MWLEFEPTHYRGKYYRGESFNADAVRELPPALMGASGIVAAANVGGEDTWKKYTVHLAAALPTETAAVAENVCGFSVGLAPPGGACGAVSPF